MRVFLKLFLVFVIVLIVAIANEMDLKQVWQWEFFIVLIVGLFIWLFFIWRRCMRLKYTPVSIQFLDD